MTTTATRAIRAVALVLIVLICTAVTCACQPTGSARCDQLVGGFAPRAVIEQHGYRVDCDPGFSSWSESEGRYVSGWDDTSTHTIWIWPDRIRVFANAGSPDAHLLHTFWHEAGHTTGLTSECAADRYAYKHMKPAEREGIGFVMC